MIIVFLFPGEPELIGYADAELVLAVVRTRAEHLAGTDLAGGVVCLHHQIRQRTPIEAKRPETHLAPVVANQSILTRLLRIIIIIMYKGIDHRESIDMGEERLQIDPHFRAPVNGSLGHRPHTAIGRLAGIATVGSRHTYRLSDVA